MRPSYIVSEIYYSIIFVRHYSKELKEVKDQLNIEKRFNEMDKRLSMIESWKKKGEINPKIILIIILFILFFLYLRSLGILK